MIFILTMKATNSTGRSRMRCTASRLINQISAVYRAALGFAYDFTNAVYGKLNLSRGFRAPNIAESGSDGIHDGTLYEIGDPNRSLKQACSLTQRWVFPIKILLQKPTSLSTASTTIFSRKSYRALMAATRCVQTLLLKKAAMKQ